MSCKAHPGLVHSKANRVFVYAPDTDVLEPVKACGAASAMKLSVSPMLSVSPRLCPLPCAEHKHAHKVDGVQRSSPQLAPLWQRALAVSHCC